MHDWFEEVKDIIIQALSNLSFVILLHIISKLQISGREYKEDLKHVQQEDLNNILPVVNSFDFLLFLFALILCIISEMEMVTLELEVMTSSLKCTWPVLP